MRYSLTDFALAAGIAAPAALGGAFAVYAGYDDAPGGVLIGMALVVVSFVLALRARRSSNR